MNREYLDAARLLLAVAPSIFRRPGFALKGGTAINLFLREMPRLSVDLDLVFADHRRGRDDAMRMIARDLELIRADLKELGMTCHAARGQGDELKLFIERNRTRIKVEVNHVFRGAVLPVVSRPLTAKAQRGSRGQSFNVGFFRISCRYFLAFRSFFKRSRARPICCFGASSNNVNIKCLTPIPRF